MGCDQASEFLASAADADGDQHLFIGRPQFVRMNNRRAVQQAACLAGIDIKPAGNYDALCRQQALPGTPLQAGPGHDDGFPAGEKTGQKVMQFAGAEGVGRIRIHGAGRSPGMVAPEKKRLRQARKTDAGSCHAQPEVVIFGPPAVTITAHT